MKKIITMAIAVIFSASIASAETVFLSLTKYDTDIEKLPTNVTVISQQEIQDKHVESLGELLKNEVGINFISYGTLGATQSVFLRGVSGSARTLVLIDGRKVNDVGSGGVDFANIPVSNIERVEIIRGAGAAIYGTGAFGGVINVITKRAHQNSPIVDVGISYGTFNTLSPSITGAYAANNFAGLIAGSYYSSDGDRENTKFEGFNGFFSGQAKIGESQELSLTGDVHNSKYGVISSQLQITPDDKQETDSKYAKLDYTVSLDEDSKIKISGYASENIIDFKHFYSIPDDYTSKYRSKYINKVYGAQVDFHYKEHLLFGAEWRNDNYKRDDIIPVDYGYGANDSSFEHSLENKAVYSQFTYAIGKLLVIPGLRGDNNSQYGDVFTPSISAIFNANDNIKISGNSGKVWRAPTFNDLYYPGYSNPDLKPEKGVSSDLGIEFRADKVKLLITGYYITTDDLISSNKNIGKTRQSGVEFEGGYIMTAWLTHKINYTYLEAKDITDSKNEKTIAYSPKHTLNYSLIVKPIQDLTISAIAFYRVEQIGTRWFPDYSSEEIDMKPIFTLDLYANYRINERLNIWIKGFNITNAKYEMFPDYPMPGAAVFAGVNIKFFPPATK